LRFDFEATSCPNSEEPEIAIRQIKENIFMAPNFAFLDQEL
jgi:hypothetical protein